MATKYRSNFGAIYSLRSAFVLAASWIICASVGAEQKFFSVKSSEGYPHSLDVLQDLVQRDGRALVNHFCAVGYVDPDGDRHAWLYWKEGNKLILWEPSSMPEYPLSLCFSHRYLDLKKDVVKTLADVRGSTYLVTQDWVNKTLADCAKHGDRFVVTKKRHWKCPYELSP
jgi:hypothetical protein